MALVGAAGFRAIPGVLIDPLQEEFGWSRGDDLGRVSVNMAAVRAHRAVRRRADGPVRHPPGGHRARCCVVALGSGLTVFMTASWQLILLWGVLVGLGTGSMALAFVATVTGRWFVARRGLVTGVLTAGGAAGQLIFLPLVAWSTRHGWRAARSAPRPRRSPSSRWWSGCCATGPRDLGVAAVRRDRGRRVDPVRTGAGAARRSAALVRARAPGRSGCWPAAS